MIEPRIAPKPRLDPGSNIAGLIRVWQLMGDGRSGMVRAMVFRLLQSFSLGMAYAATLWVIQGLSEGREMTIDWVLQITGIMVLSLLLQLLFSFLSVRDAWQVSFQIAGQLRLALLDRLYSLPLGFHLTRQKGDLANTISTDIAMVENFLSDVMARIVQAFGLPFAVFLFMLTLDARLAFALGLTIALGLPIMSFTGRRTAVLSLQRQDKQAEASSQMVEFVLGMKVIRAFGRLDEGNARFRRAIDQFRDVSVSMVTRLVTPIMVFLTILMLGIPVTYMATGALYDNLRPGVAITALVLAFAMYSPIVALVSVTEMVRMAEASLLRIDRVLREHPMPEPQQPQNPKGFAISARDVRFDYGTGQDVLKGVSFDVPERSMTAIVGPSGSGKSTILNLIARFWDVSEGQITLGGVALPEMHSNVLMDHISYVFQDVFLFSGSVAANIRLGRPDASDEEIQHAARLAQAHEFVMALPKGYDEEIGEGGARLSGGEKQRIAIARAILKDAPVVLLDEPTAAIDPINERAIQTGLGNLVANRTLIVVAHKLSTISSADQILVLRDGQIEEQGNHDNLMAENGHYARLFTRKSEADSWTLSN